VERLRSALRATATDEPGAGSTNEDDLARAVERAQQGFSEAMDDDFHTPGALARLFELARAIHVARDAGISAVGLQLGQGALRQLAGTLGLRLAAAGTEGHESAALIDLLVEVREELRGLKEFELADRIRRRLEEQDIVLEDGKGGTRWRTR
jgi:cysteinyl-tRNA synthetase